MWLERSEQREQHEISKVRDSNPGLADSNTQHRAQAAVCKGTAQGLPLEDQGDPRFQAPPLRVWNLTMELELSAYKEKK